MNTSKLIPAQVRFAACENPQKRLDGAIPIGILCSPKSKDFMCGKIRRFEAIGLLAFGLSIAPLFNGFCQNTNPVLQISKPSPNAPAVVSWNSNTNEIYTLLYSTNLAAGFLPVVTDFPNQGTNTVWSDTGTESGLGNYPSSADSEAPVRFYQLQVQGYMSNSLPATISFGNVINSTVLSGLTNVLASATSPSNLISGKLSVDGNDVAFGSGDAYDFPLDTQRYANGIHRLTITVEDNGDSGSTGGDDPGVPGNGEESSASYAAQNISVTFSNFLSDVWVKYQGYRPELGQTQEIHGTWGSPRDWKVDITSADNTNSVYQTFTGSGTSIFVCWDGLDSSGNQLNPQRVAYVIYDLGVASGMSAASVSTMIANSPESVKLWAVPKNGAGNPVLLNLYPPGMDTNSMMLFEATSSQILPARTLQSSQNLKVAQSFGGGGIYAPNGSNGTSAEPYIVYSTYKTFGTFGMLYQGHHPYFSPSNRPQRGLPFGQVTFATGHNPPWGKLKAVKRIAKDLAVRMPMAGYRLGFIYGDDDVNGNYLRKSSLGGSSIFNDVTIGLFAGHSAACKENIVALAHPQSYIPIYNTGAGSMDWVGMNDMNWGSSNLKWLAFYSCNLFRDSKYRANGCYALMKNNGHLAINSRLHIMQGFATEMTVRHDMGVFWVHALIGGTGIASDSTVLGAWRFVCMNTQPKEAPADANVSRSIYWPECASDHIYGYGSQTDPDLNNLQSELQEDDQIAPTQ